MAAALPAHADQRGYFYTGSFTNPPASIARATTASQCQSGYSGYTGFSTVRDVGDAANLSFSESNSTVMFGSRAHTCNMGVIVFKQGNRSPPPRSDARASAPSGVAAGRTVFPTPSPQCRGPTPRRAPRGAMAGRR
jgi:hypothetical protein